MRGIPGIVLQARIGSTRLPGKVLEPIAGRPMLEHCVRRLRAAGIGPVVLATTERPEDDVLVDLAGTLEVPVFRGSEDDVLGRYIGAAVQYGLDPVIRATADNPLVDGAAAGRLLQVIGASGVDYACEVGLPVGAAVEAVRIEALVQAALFATDPSDREHVTTFIKRRQDFFKVRLVPAPPALRSPALRLTVDTAEDLARVRGLIEATGTDMPTLGELLAVAKPSQQEVA